MALARVLDFEPHFKNLSEDEIPNYASIFQCCAGLITIDPVTSMVRLMHYDISQYMRQNWNDLFSQKKLMLGQICTAYLSLEAFSNGPCHQVDVFWRRLEQYFFLDYASRYWGYHIRQVSSLRNIDKYAFGKTTWLLKNGMNLEPCLQVAEMKPEVQEIILRDRKQVYALEVDRLESISLLQIATRHGLTKIVQNKINMVPRSVLDQDSYGTSALHEAGRAGWVDLVNILLAAGAQPSVMDGGGKTPLYYAVVRGHAEIMSILKKFEDISQLKKSLSLVSQVGNNHESKTSMHITQEKPLQLEEAQLKEALYDAVEAGNLNAIRSLLGYNLNSESEILGTSVLVTAVYRGHEEVVK